MRTANCPTCSTSIEWDEKNQFKPFCSYRCKLIDLGDWFAEKNAIACQDQDEE